MGADGCRLPAALRCSGAGLRFQAFYHALMASVPQLPKHGLQQALARYKAVLEAHADNQDCLRALIEMAVEAGVPGTCRLLKHCASHVLSGPGQCAQADSHRSMQRSWPVRKTSTCVQLSQSCPVSFLVQAEPTWATTGSCATKRSLPGASDRGRPRKAQPCSL